MKSDATQKSVKNYTIEQFMKTESLAGVSISHDDMNLIYASDVSGVFNAYSIPTDGKGERTKLTDSSTNAIFPVTAFPEDNRFLYQSDQGGDEITHLYIQNADGTPTDLTPGENEKAMFHGWSEDEKSFFYESNKRDSRYMDLYEMEIASFKPKLIFKNEKGYQVSAISPDKQAIALHKTITANNSEMYIFTNETGCKHLSPHDGDVQFIPAAFDAESEYLYYLTDEASEFLYLKRMHIASEATETVLEAEWDILLAEFSPQYTYLIYAINNNGKIQLKLMETTSGKQMDIPTIPDGQISDVTISKSEHKMALLVNTSTSPANLYVYDFLNVKLDCLTNTLNPEIDAGDLVQAEVVNFPSFDGLSIPAIFYEPYLNPDEKAPALVWVHGGPGGQSMVNYNPLFQYLANHGYAVLAVNNRGSSGYGKTFFKAADLKHGEIDLADCVEAKSYLQGKEIINKNQIGIIGVSYGGYMVLAGLAFQPDVFEVGVDIFGVSNWERTLKEIPSWWEAQRDALYKKIGDPFTDTEYIRSISPLFHADKINKPLIVLQGANDPRVLQAESDEIVEAVKENDVPVEYIVFEDEGHGFSKRKNSTKGFQAILDFLDKYLKK